MVKVVYKKEPVPNTPSPGDMVIVSVFPGRLRALIECRCNRDDIRKIREPLKPDIADDFAKMAP